MHLTKNIYLTGFMGTGKSSVGGRLACRLGIAFIDTDSLITARLGITIEKIFSKKGEDFFRKEEQKVLQEMRHSPPRVIGAGGGMVLSLLNREIFRQGIWINLKATPATIMKRIGPQNYRPLLGKKVKRDGIESLLKKRQPYYDLAPYQIETDGLSPHAVVEKIVKILSSTPTI